MSTAKTNRPRPNLFDNLLPDPALNLFCERKDLSNEAAVESFFVLPLLKALGYRNNQIQPKTSISELSVPRGSKKVNYKPDFALTYRRKPRWVIDAKHPNESLDSWVEQCSGYCLLLNQQFDDDNPVEYFVLTNGILTRLYKWDVGTPLLEIKFEDFDIGNPNFERFAAILSASQVNSGQRPKVEEKSFIFKRPSAEEAKRIFAQCHKAIWKSEGYSPTAAFMEFVKLMFVKMWCDRELRENPALKTILETGESVKLPAGSVTFSVDWITRNNESDNPVSDVLFKKLRDRIELDIQERKKKRIFEADERIEMRADTIKTVVKKLQHFDMFGIDAR